MEETQDQPVTIYNHALKFGLILGVISIMCVILIYVVDLSIMASFKFLGIMLVLGLGVTIYAGINYRNEIGGFLPYGKAFIHGAVLLAVSGLVGLVFNLVLYTIIDPELPQKLTEAIAENTEQLMTRFGAPPESIEPALDKIRAETPANFAPFGLVKGYLTALIWYAVIAAITSLFVRKNQPVEQM